MPADPGRCPGLWLWLPLWGESRSHLGARQGRLTRRVRSVIYQVQAFRSTRAGKIAAHYVSFAAPRGLPMPGTGTMQLAGGMKLAA